MSEKPIFYQLFNKLTPLPARPSDLKLAHWKPGINLLSAKPQQTKQQKTKDKRCHDTCLACFPPSAPLARKKPTREARGVSPAPAAAAGQFKTFFLV
jgi:hypothetical protein